MGRMSIRSVFLLTIYKGNQMYKSALGSFFCIVGSQKQILSTLADKMRQDKEWEKGDAYEQCVTYRGP